MITKIMSEASRSIIGMLSAKPVDMETRSANMEFSSLLLSGENRSRATIENVADADKESGAEDNIEQFLSQLTGLPVVPVNNKDTAKTIGMNVPVTASDGKTQLPSDLSQSSASTSGSERFSQAKPVLGEQSGNDARANVSSPKADAMTGLSNRTSTEANVDAQIDPKPSFPTDDKSSSADEKKLSALSTASIAKNITQDGDKASVAAKPYNEAQSDDKSRANGSGKAPLAALGTQSVNLEPSGAGQKVQELLNLQQTARGKAVASKEQRPAVTNAREAAIAAKPMKTEGGSFFLDMDNLPVAGHQDKNVELPAAVQASSPNAVTAGNNSAAKTVSFDWNAPQFAERFAAEMLELTVNGDHKKFEINPRNMGRLELSFLSRGSAEVMRIETESDAAREVIMQHSQAIQDLLKASGRSDLTLRVDVRENMFAASDNSGMNFNQQENTGERKEGSTPSGHGRTASSIESDTEPLRSTDNSRYA
ncbi:hypothetical protein AB1K62_01400 [Parasphingorhabdus sp. JC815]|uniref:hypothetical protein n=1 Tax=Parasphingorhabdus sp. JC815 TaxID=3232140 RepID=UPI0034577A5C